MTVQIASGPTGLPGEHAPEVAEAVEPWWVVESRGEPWRVVEPREGRGTPWDPCADQVEFRTGAAPLPLRQWVRA